MYAPLIVWIGTCDVVVGTQALLRGSIGRGNGRKDRNRGRDRRSQRSSAGESHGGSEGGSNKEGHPRGESPHGQGQGQQGQGQQGHVAGSVIEFERLGLVVIDEEQRFGVMQKEHLKRLVAPGVDVLSLSATPIPRTLQLAQLGIRGLSKIHHPPPGRLPPKTFVGAFSKARIKDAINNEINRGGQ
eukprot:343288-Amorphochlora_amoeboformis.AAC.1